MKELIKICLLLVFIINISCDDNLDLEPVNSTTPEIFYTTPANLEAGLYGVYDALQLDGMFGNQVLIEGMSDNCITDVNFAPDLGPYANGDKFDSSLEFKSLYLDAYVLIQRANLLLDFADGIDGITPTTLATIKAEAKALRAIAYMRLVYFFGDVPFIETFTSREEVLQLSRTSRSTIISFVLTELESAAGDLNTTAAADGRLTKQAVLGLRAKVMLYEARMGNQTWADALTAINETISAADAGGHGLVDTDNPLSDYQSLFTEANEGNSEFIFSVRNNSTDIGISFRGRYSWSAGTLALYIHQNLADAYSYSDGTTYLPTDDTYVGRDPRLSTNIMHEGLIFNGLTYDGTDGGGFVGGNSFSTATNLFMYKFNTTDFNSSFNEGTLDVPVLRYADLLLMQAEALNETGGNGHTALNLVRDRAGLPALSGLSQSDLRDEIIKERRLELALEGQRWFDLITLDIADTVINAIVEENATVQRGFTVGRSELLPIPETERGFNPNLTQNPGY
jgi:hypothetical protein